MRGEFTDAVMMRDYDRVASLFTTDGALRIPEIPLDLTGRQQIRAWGDGVPTVVDFLVQTTHVGTIRLDGTPRPVVRTSRSWSRARDDRSGLNFAIYHDRYQRTGDGWQFTERVYEIRYLDTTPLAGTAPGVAAPGPTQRT